MRARSLIAFVLLAACGGVEPPRRNTDDDAGGDAGALADSARPAGGDAHVSDASADAAGTDAALPADLDSAASDATVEPDGSGPSGDAATDAGPPLRDDALLPEWRWDEKAARAIDPAHLDELFAAAGYALPADAELYAVRIVPGVDGPAYVLFESGGGAFSQGFWPASTVKVLAAVGALDFAASIGFTGDALVTFDSGFGDTLRAIYDRAIRMSSNLDYDRTVRVAGFDRLNAEVLTPERGFPTTIIQRSYSGVGVRDVPGMTFDEAGRSLHVDARPGAGDYGCGADGNCADLFELVEGVRRVVLDAEIPPAERFSFSPNDVTGLTDALCAADPSFFADGATRALGGPARICHKPGWVPDLDCLDTGLVEDPATGDRWLIGASVPLGSGLAECSYLSDMAERVIHALDAASPGVPLQQDAGVAMVVQLDDRGSAGGLRAYTVTVEAPGADGVELWADRFPLGSASGPGPRFSLDHAFSAGGERLLSVRAVRGAGPIGFRSLRVMITAP